VSLENLELTLSQLTDIGTPVKLRPYREIWRFEHNGRAMYLKWYPRDRARLKRLVRGDPALREYQRLQHLQHKSIPAPRAVALLSGLLLHGRKGDGVLTWELPGGIQLDHHIHSFRAQGSPIPQRAGLARDVLALIKQLAVARLGHSDLHLGNILHTPQGLHLLDAYSLRYGPLSVADLEVLALSASAATRTDLLRAWKLLGPPNTPLPPVTTPAAKRLWRKTAQRMSADNAYCMRLQIAGYEGLAFRSWKFPVRHSPASALDITPEDWKSELPRLLTQLDADTLYPLKRSRSADVLTGTLVLAGVPLDVVIKRYFRRPAYRHLTELPRGGRAIRAWRKSWMLIARNLPTAWPLAVFQRKRFGVLLDQFFISQLVPGRQLDNLELVGPDRELALRRTGAILRRIDDTGIVHFDTKASNFIVRADPVTGPQPVLVDVDGIRSYRWRGEGLTRTLRSMADHCPTFTPDDDLHLRLGYNPFLRTT
jgi:hypothetical protein